MDSKNKVSRRIQEHKKGVELMLSGKIAEALTCYESAVERFGPHVGLLSEIVSCKLYLQDLKGWKKSLATLQSEYERNKSLLSDNSSSRTLISLYRNIDELIEPAIALDYIYQAIELHPIIQFKAQELRMKALYGLKEGLSELYWEIIQSQSGNWEKQDHYLAMALLRAELELFGFEHGFATFQTIIKKTKRHAEAEWAYIHILEWSHINDHTNGLELLKNHEVHTNTVLGKTLIKLNNGDLFTPSDLDLLAEQLTPLSYLKILYILLTRSHRLNVSCLNSNDLRRRFLSLLEGVSPESKKIVQWKFKNIFNTQRVSAELNIKDKVLTFEQQTLDFKRKKQAIDLITAFKTTNEISLQDAVEKVWNGSFDGKSYNRVRMFVNRLNKDLAPIVGVPQTFTVTKTHISLSDSLNFSIVA